MSELPTTANPLKPNRISSEDLARIYSDTEGRPNPSSPPKSRPSPPGTIKALHGSLNEAPGFSYRINDSANYIGNSIPAEAFNAKPFQAGIIQSSFLPDPRGSVGNVPPRSSINDSTAQPLNPSNVRRQSTAGSGGLRKIGTMSSNHESEGGADRREAYENVNELRMPEIPAWNFELNSLAAIEAFTSSPLTPGARGKLLCVASDVFVPSFAFLTQLRQISHDQGLELAFANYDIEEIEDSYAALQIPAVFFLEKKKVYEGCDFAEFESKFMADLFEGRNTNQQTLSQAVDHVLNSN